MKRTNEAYVRWHDWNKKGEGIPEGKINIEKIGVIKSYRLTGVLTSDESKNLS